MPAPLLGARMGLPGPVEMAGSDKPGMVVTTGDEEFWDGLPHVPCTEAGLCLHG